MTYDVGLREVPPQIGGHESWPPHLVEFCAVRALVRAGSDDLTK